MALARIKYVAFVLLAFFTVVGAPAAAENVTFNGEVTYRERIALPSNARLWVTLVSMADGSPIVSAQSGLAGNVPLHFTLNVRSNVIKPDRAYGLLAEIRSGDQTLFRTLEPVTVDAVEPNYVRILLTYDPSPLPPAPPPVPGPVPGLVDIVWTVTSIGGDPIAPNSKVTFSIATDQRVGGSSGCNNYFAEASIDGTKLALGPVAATEMACAPAIMAQEARFFAALAAANGYEVSGNALKLVDAAGVALAGFVRAP